MILYYLYTTTQAVPEVQTFTPTVWQSEVCREAPVCQFCQILSVKEQKNMRWGVREGMQDVKGTVLNAISGATAVNHVWQLQRLKPVPESLQPIRAPVAVSEPAASEAPKKSVSAFWHPPRLNVTEHHWVLMPHSPSLMGWIWLSTHHCCATDASLLSLSFCPPVSGQSNAEKAFPTPKMWKIFSKSNLKHIYKFLKMSLFSMLSLEIHAFSEKDSFNFIL